MESTARHSNNLLIREIIDELWRVLLELKTGAQTPIRSVAPEIDFSSLRDGSTVALSRTHLADSPLGQFEDLRRYQHVFFVSMSESTLLAAAPRENLLISSDAD